MKTKGEIMRDFTEMLNDLQNRGVGSLGTSTVIYGIGFQLMSVFVDIRDILNGLLVEYEQRRE